MVFVGEGRVLEETAFFFITTSHLPPRALPRTGLLASRPFPNNRQTNSAGVPPAPIATRPPAIAFLSWTPLRFAVRPPLNHALMPYETTA